MSAGLSGVFDPGAADKTLATLAWNFLYFALINITFLANTFR
jgi:hypothetical protein